MSEPDLNIETCQVLLHKMTQVYTMVTVTAANEDHAIEQATDSVEDFTHHRLPEKGVWSLIPAVDILLPAEAGEPEVLGVYEGAVETRERSSWGTELRKAK